MSEETKIIYIRVDASKAVDGSSAATRAFERMEKSTGSVARSIEGFERTMRGAISGYLGTQGVRALIDAADAFTKFENALRTAGTSAGEMTAVSDRLFSAANRNGVEIGALSTLYSRASMAAGELGASQDKLLKFVDGVTAGLRLQGGSTESASGALLQLSQALGSGIVRAEEFNSILEGAFPIAQAAARGIDGMGGSVAKLRTAVANGEVTSAKFFEGLLKGFVQTERQAAGMSLTVRQATTVLQNGFIRLVGEVDRSTGATGSLAKMMARLGEHFDDIARKQAMLSGKSESNWVDDTIAAFDRLDAWLQKGAIATNKWLVETVDGLAVAGARGSAMFLEAFRALPEQLGKLFTDGMNGAIDAVEKGLTTISGAFADSWLGRQLGATAQTLNLGRLSGGGASLGDYSKQIVAAGDAAEKQMLGLQAYARAGQAADAASIFYGTEAGKAGKLPPVAPPAPTGKGGQALQDRLDKLTRDSQLELDAATAFAEASERGALAVEKLEIHFKALKAAQDAYGNTADKNAGQVAALTAKLEAQMQAAERLKNLKDFNLATEDLERNNLLLAAENALINASVEDRTRELALIRVKNEVQAKGLDENNEKERQAIERRMAAVTANERLKAQADELKRANEMWTEPLKSALQSIQSTAADWIGSLLDGLGQGKLAVEDFGKAGIAIAKRMVSEFLALAVIRPMIGSLVGSLSSIGLVSPSTASSLGYGTSAGGASGGAGGLGSIGGIGGGFGSGLGSMFGFWNQPISFGSAPHVSTPASMAGPTGMSGASLGGLTWGQGIGALAGAGMGAFQLVNAKGNTGKTIGGIASMIGAGVSLIPGIGQIAGPIISVLGGLLPGLFGGEEYKWDPMAGGNTRFTPGVKKSTIHSTEINGGESIGGRYARTWGVIDELLRATGGAIDPARAYSGDIWNNQRDGYSSVALIGPDGQSRILGGGEGDRSQDLDTLIGSVFSANVKYGGLTGISDTLKKAVNNREPGSEQEVRDLLSLIDAYDKFGKVIPSAKASLEEINKKFATMTDTARLYGLALDPIAAEQKKVTERYARDFIDSFIDPLAVELRSLDDERKDAIASAEYIRDHVAGVYVDINKITESFLGKETALREKAYDGALKSLDDAIRRMTPGGDLANMNDTATLAGLRATFNATTAQALAGDSIARARIAGEGTALADYGSRYYGGNVDYNALRDEILGIFVQVKAQLDPSTSTTAGQGGQADPNAAANAQQFQQLMAAFQRSTQDNDNLRAEITRLTGLVTRLLGRAA